jgi:hypothetical protein
MNAKLPYLMKNWTRKFKTRKREVNFITFVLDEAMMEEEMATNAGTESKAPEVTRQRGNETMGPFASGHPDTSANDRRMQEQRRPRSDNRKSAGCKICSEEHQVADCKEFLTMNLDERVEARTSRFMCFKCLDNTSHNFANCRRNTKCDTCPSVTHHKLSRGFILSQVRRRRRRTTLCD